MKDSGASAGAETGSRPSGQAPTGLDASRFDPARKTFPWRFEFWGANNIDARLKAEGVLTKAGFAVGRRQRGAPSGILYGNYVIAKWRNLCDDERAQCHGQMFADDLPVTVQFGRLSPEIDDAVFAMHEAIAMEARQGRDGEARLDAQHDSAGRQASPNSSRNPSPTGTGDEGQ